jgi:hypothetical protein
MLRRLMDGRSATTLTTWGTKRTDTLSDHSQNSPNLTQLIKSYYISVQIATKNPEVLQDIVQMLQEGSLFRKLLMNQKIINLHP